jgi:hypothetical protein
MISSINNPMNNRLVKLTSGVGETGLRAHTAIPWYVAMQSPTLKLILDRPSLSLYSNCFLENLTNSVTLDSITPDALHQNIAYLRDPASFQKPELSSVIETLYAAKYLELGALHYLIFFNYFLLLRGLQIIY